MYFIINEIKVKEINLRMPQGIESDIELVKGNDGDVDF